MDVRRLFKSLLALFVTAGLMVAPLVTTAVAEHSMAAGMMQMADMSDMAADMPCCPDKKSNDCQDCPFFAICMLKVVQAWPAASAVAMRHPSRERLQPLDDEVADGLERPPPDHPPRILV